MAEKLTKAARDTLAAIIENDGRYGRASGPIAELRRLGYVEDIGGYPTPFWKATEAGRTALQEQTG